MAGVIMRERDIRGFSSGGTEGFPEEVAALLELTTNHDCQTPLSLMETSFLLCVFLALTFLTPLLSIMGAPTPPASHYRTA